VMVRAADLGKSGHEAPSELEADADFVAAMEAIRREAGRRMGLGDVSRSVVPKFGLLSPARHGGTITSRYFTPTQCHPAHAVSGGICVAAAVAVPGTVAAALSSSSAEDAAGREVGNAADGTELIDMQIEHPSGSLAVALAIEHARGDVRILSGGVTRTARKIMSGTVHVPAEVWSR